MGITAFKRKKTQECSFLWYFFLNYQNESILHCMRACFPWTVSWTFFISREKINCWILTYCAWIGDVATFSKVCSRLHSSFTNIFFFLFFFFLNKNRPGYVRKKKSIIFSHPCCTMHSNTDSHYWLIKPGVLWHEGSSGLCFAVSNNVGKVSMKSRKKAKHLLLVLVKCQVTAGSWSTASEKKKT